MAQPFIPGTGPRARRRHAGLVVVVTSLVLGGRSILLWDWDCWVPRRMQEEEEEAAGKKQKQKVARPFIPGTGPRARRRHAGLVVVRER